jgi:post-segregation antitoxin (ccd killing protein)
VDITVYLPDEIGKQAKAAEINLSGLLRAAVGDELARQETIRKAIGEQPGIIELQLEDKDGRSYSGRFTGTLLDEHDDWSVYLTHDERVLVYDEKNWSVDEMTPEEAAEQLDPGKFPEALRALGVTPVLDI